MCVSLLLCEVTKWTIIVISQWNLLIFKSELQVLLTRFPSCGVRMLLFGRQVLTKIRQISTIGYSLTRGKCWGVIHTHTHWYDISLALLWKENSSEKKLQDLNYAVNLKKRTVLAHSPDYQPNSLRMFDWGCEPNSSRINIFREKLWIFSYVETKCFLIGDSVWLTEGLCIL